MSIISKIKMPGMADAYDIGVDWENVKDKPDVGSIDVGVTNEVLNIDTNNDIAVSGNSSNDNKKYLTLPSISMKIIQDNLQDNGMAYPQLFSFTGNDIIQNIDTYDGIILSIIDNTSETQEVDETTSYTSTLNQNAQSLLLSKTDTTIGMSFGSDSFSSQSISFSGVVALIGISNSFYVSPGFAVCSFGEDNGTQTVSGIFYFPDAVKQQATPVQSDWNVTNTGSLAYIKNKPNLNPLQYEVSIVENRDSETNELIDYNGTIMKDGSALGADSALRSPMTDAYNSGSLTFIINHKGYKPIIVKPVIDTSRIIFVCLSQDGKFINIEY